MATGVTETRRTYAWHLSRKRGRVSAERWRSLGDDVENDVVLLISAGHARGDVIEIQGAARPVGNVVIRARGVATYAESTDQFMIRVVESKAAPENIDAADPSTDHRIVGLSVIAWVSTLRNISGHRVAQLKAEKAAARLRGGV